MYMLLQGILMLLLSGSAFAGEVINTAHDLSVSATDESRVCIFCHTPHHAEPEGPLWNHFLSGEVYDLYTSSTLTATTGQPDGPSRLCLSCHDGTIALGNLFTLEVTSLSDSYVAGTANLSTNLADDHPVGFVYDDNLAVTNGELRKPSEMTGPDALKVKKRLDTNAGWMRCTACHDPHDNDHGNFLIGENTDSALCLLCHDQMGWSSASHALDGTDGHPNAPCGQCHLSHNAAGTRLLKEAPGVESCFDGCHDGTPDRGENILALFDLKAYSHALGDPSALHDQAEDPLTALEHVKCVDCHNPHQANSDVATAPAVAGPNLGVKGIDLDRNVVEPVAYQYELCFRCHADNAFDDAVAVPRQIEELNQRRRFDTANPSYHPVTAGGRSSSVPSLKTGLTAGTSRIYCTDCHGNDDPAGPDGPHGSENPLLLRDDYWFEGTASTAKYNHVYVESEYALCFRCHDPTILLAAGTFHYNHVQTYQAPCFVCHDPHGVPGTDPANSRLINFTTLYGITASYDGVSCTASCH